MSIIIDYSYIMYGYDVVKNNKNNRKIKDSKRQNTNIELISKLYIIFLQYNTNVCIFEYIFKYISSHIFTIRHMCTYG